MTTVAEIVETLDQWYPRDLAEDWDNTGLLLGDARSNVRVAMTTLTLTEDVAEEACREDVGLIVSHHPILFRGAKQLTTDTAEGRIVLQLAQSGIAVYSPHTRFDSGQAGINQYLAERLGLSEIAPLRPSADAEQIGSGRFGVLANPVGASEFAAVVSEVCGVPGIHVVDSGKSVTKVAVACGAAGEFLNDAIRLGCDGFVVGECRFHSALEARSSGVSLFVPGHYGSERPAVEWLANEISQSFSAVRTFASAVEVDPLSWHTAHG